MLTKLLAYKQRIDAVKLEKKKKKNALHKKHDTA